MFTYHFNYRKDLEVSAQNEILEEVTSFVRDEIETEGLELMSPGKWFVAPKNWQEAYARTHALDYWSWKDLLETGIEFQNFDWNQIIEDEVASKADEICAKINFTVTVEPEL